MSNFGTEFIPAGRRCPVLTERHTSLQEACGMECPEIRAYKLGKKRWSYNQVELVIVEGGGSRQLHVQQASSMSGPEDNEVRVYTRFTMFFPV